MKYLVATVVSLFLIGCGGGGTSPELPAANTQVIGEIFSTPAQLSQSELRTSIGYSGNVATSRAIQASGRANILDMLFVTDGSSTTGRLSPDLSNQIDNYISANLDLLRPGVRVLVADEVFWNPPNNSDDPAVLQSELTALKSAVALLRTKLPNASIGITVTPYATFSRPNTLQYIRQAIALVDWVGTDPYWLGDTATIPALHAWTSAFPKLARAARPGVEVWYVAQAFRLESWDLSVFRGFIAEELAMTPAYDGVLFFGWQFASEIDTAITGNRFDAQTKELYRRFMF